MSKIKVSIILVYYQKFDALLTCLDSIYRLKTKSSIEVIIVDNSKESVGSEIEKKFKKVRYLKSPGNIGYGAGNNLGAEKAKGKYLFILNPDTSVKKSAIDNLVSFLDSNRKTAIVAPNLVDKEDKLFESMGNTELTPMKAIFSLTFINKLFPNNPVARKYWLKDSDKHKKRKVDVVPGTAFMIRKSVYKNLGGFDKYFFLYFEEFDLCRKVSMEGWDIYMIPQAVITHYWYSKKGNKSLRTAFNRSRYYYFKNNFGLIPTLTVELFSRLNKYNLFFIFLVTILISSRFWEIGKHINFGGDIGCYYIQARDMILSGNIPPTGISSSVPILHQGALWTWILALALKLGNFSPVAGAILAGIFGVSSGIVSYLLIKSWYGRKIALIALAFIATSPYLIFHDRMPFETAPIFLFTILNAWSVVESLKGKTIHFILLGLWLAILFQLELAAFVLILLTGLIFLIYRTKISIKDILLTIFSGTIGLLPFILSDLKSGHFIQTYGFLAWFTSKLIEPITALLKGTVLTSIDFGRGSEYLNEFIFPYSKLTPIVVFVALLLYLTLDLYKNIRKDPKSVFISIWLISVLLSFFVRGAVSAAYLPLIFFPFTVILARLYHKAFVKYKLVTSLTLLLLFILNLYYAISTLKNDPNENISYPKMLSVSTEIISDADGRVFQYNYFGPNDQFETSDDPWIYLLWWMGNEPRTGSELKYVVADFPAKLPVGYKRMGEFTELSVGVKND